MRQAQEQLYCVACETGLLRFFGRRRAYAYHECARCRTLQLVPMPSAEALEAAYAEEYAHEGHLQGDPQVHNAAARTQFEAIVDVLRTHKVRGLVLDYGAGWGGLMMAMREHGIACEGFELSKEMTAYCGGQGLDVRRQSLDASVEPDRYGAIVLSAVFEHLVEHDSWLENGHRALKTGGLIVSLQPTSVFPGFMGRVLRLGLRRLPLPQLHKVLCPPWHTVLFSPEGMRLLFERHGFELLDVLPAPQQRDKGLIGFAQRGLELINRLGWPLLGKRWPLMIGHIFVFRSVTPQQHVP